MFKSLSGQKYPLSAPVCNCRDNFFVRQVTGGAKTGTLTDAFPSSGTILGFNGGTFVATKTETRFGH